MDNWTEHQAQVEACIQQGANAAFQVLLAKTGHIIWLIHHRPSASAFLRQNFGRLFRIAMFPVPYEPGLSSMGLALGTVRPRALAAYKGL